MLNRELHLRPETLADQEVIAQVTRLAFDQTRGEEVRMVADCRASADFIPALALVAELSGRVVGHVTTFRPSFAAALKTRHARAGCCLWDRSMCCRSSSAGASAAP